MGDRKAATAGPGGFYPRPAPMDKTSSSQKSAPDAKMVSTTSSGRPAGGRGTTTKSGGGWSETERTSRTGSTKFAEDDGSRGFSSSSAHATKMSSFGWRKTHGARIAKERENKYLSDREKMTVSHEGFLRVSPTAGGEKKFSKTSGAFFAGGGGGPAVGGPGPGLDVEDQYLYNEDQQYPGSIPPHRGYEDHGPFYAVTK